MNVETLQDQYDTVKAKTTKSHVLQWGQLTFTDEPIGDFESGKDAEKPDFWTMLKSKGKRAIKDTFKYESRSTELKNDFAVDSRDIKLHYHYTKVMNDPTEENQKELQDEISNRMKVDKIFKEAFGHHMEAIQNGTTPNPTDFECYRTLIAAFEEKCMKIDDYSLKYMKALVAECEAIKAFPSALDATMHRLTKTCQSSTQ